jgi:uncharacterized membrane protein YbhN (UPF0104 family)
MKPTNTRRGFRFRWSWAVGLVLFAAVVLAVTHRAEGAAFLALARRARPAWMWLALAAQAGTYAAEAGVWRSVVAQRGKSPSFAALYRLSVVVLFTNQTVPAGGLAGNVFAIRALEARGVERPVAVAALLVDMVVYYAAYAASVGIAAAWLAVHHDLHPTVRVTATALVAVALGLSWVPLRLPGRTRWPMWTARFQPL